MISGWVSEWLKVSVLKTVGPQGSLGSNPSPSSTEQWSTGMKPRCLRVEAGSIPACSANAGLAQW